MNINNKRIDIGIYDALFCHIKALENNIKIKNIYSYKIKTGYAYEYLNIPFIIFKDYTSKGELQHLSLAGASNGTERDIGSLEKLYNTSKENKRIIKIVHKVLKLYFKGYN
jgi:hypothetical protein